MRPLLLLAEELTAVPAVVPSFRERKPHGAARATVTSFVLHPVVSSRTAWLVTHRPAENPASTVTDEDPTVIPAGDMTQSPSGKASAQLRALPLTLAALQFSGGVWARVWVECMKRERQPEVYTSISTHFGSNLVVSSSDLSVQAT